MISPGFSLPKKERILKTALFKHILNNGNRLRSRDMLVLFKENHLGVNRIGFIAPKSRIKLATARNSTKRCLREAYRLNKNMVGSGIDVLIMANRQIKTLDEAKTALLPLINRIKFPRNPLQRF